MLEELKQTDWWPLLLQAMGEQYWQEVETFLERVYAQGTVYPPRELVFNALLTTSLAQTKVVILGQDPYPNANQAMGLSFSVPANQPLPKSLVNIYKELEDDTGVLAPSNGDLTSWAEQGVLLLNTVLTVPAGERNGHAHILWEQLTDAIIKIVAKQNQPVAFVLWGKPAQAKEVLIEQSQQHLIIASPHPSPLSSYRGFFGSKPFTRVNDFLVQQGITPISWS
ncbi:MAG: uracil-DNA glycosylase [Lactobacillaceae bacterium]|jgi:uracil-DNA glycosylase|nr:uracil-DNA glycosylase [Lactobacillaceae bacterium]